MAKNPPVLPSQNNVLSNLVDTSSPVSLIQFAGAIAYITGIVISALLGILMQGFLRETISGVIILGGLVVGIMNLFARDARSFVINSAGIVIVIALGGAVLSQIPGLGDLFEQMLAAVLSFIIPVTLIVAISESSRALLFKE